MCFFNLKRTKDKKSLHCQTEEDRKAFCIVLYPKTMQKIEKIKETILGGTSTSEAMRKIVGIAYRDLSHEKEEKIVLILNNKKKKKKQIWLSSSV